MKKLTVKVMAEIAIFAAIGWILDFLAGIYSEPFWAMGGSLGIAMVAVFIMSYRNGTVAGVLTGLIMSILDMLDGFYAISSSWYNVLLQLALDYFVAMSVVGLAGVTRKLVVGNDNKVMASLFMGLGCLLGTVARFMCHFISGALYWSEWFDHAKYANEWVYSFCYNAPYVFISGVLSFVVLLLINLKAPQFINPSEEGGEE